jgi:TPP-dependent indolepyruvate ferredoxin oxidoreductase alpha subunit
MAEMGNERIVDFGDLLLKNIKTSQELIVYEGHAEVDLDKCNACGLCWKIGHCCAISHPDDRTTIDRKTCIACSTCADICPQKATHMVQV